MMKTSSLVIRSAVIAALGGLLFGFDTAVISGTVGSLKSVFLLDHWWLGFTVASALIGTILGAATVQWPSNRFGRKPTLILMAALYFISAVGSACPWNFGELGTNDWLLFMFFRFIGGIAVGGASVVSPLYTAEISPAKTRGVLVAVTQFNIVFGILAAFFSNYLISGMNLGDLAWRWMFGVEAFPAALFFVLLFIVPESPRWLIGKDKTDRARPILAALGTDTGCDADSVDEEIRIIETAIEEEKQGGKEKLFCYRYRFPIFLAICMAAFNQLSGINAILYYAPTVFEMTGVEKQTAMFLPVIIGFTNLVFTMAAMVVIDWFGRRKLMLAGSLGYITSLCIVAAAFIVYAPQFSVSIANFSVRTVKENIEKNQSALDDATEETAEFWRSELKDSYAEMILAADEARDAHRRVAGEQIVTLSAKEKEEEKAKLMGRDIETLKSEAETKLKAVNLDSTVPMAGIYVVLGGLMLFIASHAFGQGACIWVFIGEIFPNTVRAQGQALGSFVHWILAAVITQLFPPLLALLGPSTIFLGFAGLMVLQLLWVLGLMPETKQVPLEEMQKKLGITK